jgi:autotransporter passenger strand-loop-strand repeat protein
MPTVSSGGTLNVSSGHTSTGVIVDSGGTLNVLFGGKIITTTDRGTVEVFGGGVASATRVSSGGAETVDPGGTSIATTIRSGGVESVVGALLNEVRRPQRDDQQRRHAECWF